MTAVFQKFCDAAPSYEQSQVHERDTAEQEQLDPWQHSKPPRLRQILGSIRRPTTQFNRATNFFQDVSELGVLIFAKWLKFTLSALYTSSNKKLGVAKGPETGLLKLNCVSAGPDCKMMVIDNDAVSSA